MRDPLRSFLNSKVLLIAAAAPAEARAIAAPWAPSNPAPAAPWSLLNLGPGVDLVLTGIGKVNAAAAVVRVFDPSRHAGVLSCGIAGSLPGSNLSTGNAVLATECVYADEGVETPQGFLECSELGFPLGDFAGPCVPVSSALAGAILQALAPVPEALLRAPIATVSTCSGTDARAALVRGRTGAVAEAMEGAAIAHVCHRLGIPFAELRVISNTTGDRARQVWDIARALATLTQLSNALH
jgi:futalosine hydrolase